MFSKLCSIAMQAAVREEQASLRKSIAGIEVDRQAVPSLVMDYLVAHAFVKTLKNFEAATGRCATETLTTLDASLYGMLLFTCGQWCW
jgi:hypothetical protein